MKKTVTLAILFLVCAGSMGRATQSDASEIQRNTADLREQLRELEQLRDDFNANPKRIKESFYLAEAPRLLKQFEADFDQLKKRISFFLDGLEVEQRAQFESAVQSEIKQLDESLREINKDFKAKKPTEGIDKFAKPAEGVLNNIGRSLNTQGASGQQLSIDLKQPVQSPNSPDQNQPENFGFAYWPYLLALLPLIAGAVVTWFLHIRLTHLELALDKQNHAASQLRQQLDEDLDKMWQELLKLQQKSTANHQQNYAYLSAEVERLRATIHSAQLQPSSAEPRIVRRRAEEPAEFASRQVATAAPRLISVADYMRNAAGKGIRAKTAMLLPDILQPAEDGPYLLLSAEGQADVYNVIPAVPRFQSSQDYSHFSHFYDCDQPSSGEVFIVKPALAVCDHTAGQWKLRSKGRLQIS